MSAFLFPHLKTSMQTKRRFMIIINDQLTKEERCGKFIF